MIAKVTIQQLLEVKPFFPPRFDVILRKEIEFTVCKVHKKNNEYWERERGDENLRYYGKKIT